MRLRETLPWNWGKKDVPIRREEAAQERAPSVPAPHSLFDVFDDFRFRPFSMPALSAMSELGFSDDGSFLPALDAKETDDEVRITVELPGMDEKDVDIGLKDDVLTIHGEKQDETRHEKGGAQWVERRFGSFRRAIPLPADVDSEGVKAHFRAGVLTVTAPRSGRPDASRRAIPIQKG